MGGGVLSFTAMTTVSGIPMANDEDARWARAFLGHDAIMTYDRSPGKTSYEASAEVLRRVIRSGLLRFTARHDSAEDFYRLKARRCTAMSRIFIPAYCFAISRQDLRDRPSRFFDAHRLLATRVLGGFGIRFTVQFNLFAGSVLGLGTPAQVAMLEDFQRDGALGCFALTEVGAGVSSGLVVETTATFDAARDGFHLRTPTPRAAKNWISQGLTAEWCVVMADLVLPSGGRGGHYGPHPFLMRLRDGPGGALARGVEARDMGGKTVANDLDNARLSFGEGCFLPRGALLGRFCAVSPAGAYESRAPNGASRLKIEVIGQRLLTGRLCIASAALVATRVLFARTRAYTDARRVAGQDPAKGECMTTLPQLADLYARTDAEISRMERFCAVVEAELSAHLRAGTTPPDALVEAIGVAKIRAVRAGIEAAHKLKHEVGSFALMRAARRS